VVVNFGALWAAPLAAQLLALAGAQVIDVESIERPDPTRATSPEFYRRLHAGHERRRVDFADPAQLRDLIARADVVIEASRPRVFEALGLDARAILARGRPRIWLRITGHRDPSRVAFGDDAAVAGGLVAWDSGDPVFAGDAIADPLTGILAAVAAAAALRSDASCLIEMSLADVAAYCAR
jgi:crotonobetainyl-CoA:carnitine CoA-transferase CaiB-like acyl-CoA transferase